jgi:hypothetical protein
MRFIVFRSPPVSPMINTLPTPSMPDIQQLCVRAAHMVFPTGAASEARPAILGSDDGNALTVLTANADPALKEDDVALALRSFTWVLHVRACTVNGWRPRGTTGPTPEAAVGVDCYSTSGRWQVVLGVCDGRLQPPSSFREVVELHPLSAWRFAGASTSPDPSDEPNWAQYAYRQQAQLEADPVGRIEAQIAHNKEQLHDLENGLTVRLDFSPVVAYDFAQHSAAADLEALGRMATGFTDPVALLGKLGGTADTLRTSHCASLLGRFVGKLPRPEGARLARLLEQPTPEVLRQLEPHQTLPEAKALAYWLTSADHGTEGLSMTKLAKAFRAAPKAFEAALVVSPFVFSTTCPVCDGNARYDVQRLSISSKLITFSMRCDACGHQEAYHRTGAWTGGQLSCSCKTCVKRQRQACAVHLPRVVIALEDALHAAPSVASQALRAAAGRIATANPDLPDDQQAAENPHVATEWDAKHAVYLRTVQHEDPAPVHQFHPTIELGELRVGALDEAVHAMASLGPTHVRYLEHRLSEGKSPGDAFADLPDCIHLLLEGDSLAPSEMLATWTTALGASGLLHADRAQFGKLLLLPYGWLMCEFSSVRQGEIQTREDLVVTREVPKAEELMLFIRDAITQDDEYEIYAETAITVGHAAAPAHGRHLLDLARAIMAPEAQGILQQLAQGQSVPTESLRCAREAFERDHNDAALFYAALLWNYSYPPAGNGKAPLPFSKLAVFSRIIVDAAREHHSVTTTVSCRRCADRAALMTFWRESQSQDGWRVDCKECGHVEASRGYSARYGRKYCDCQHCANATSVALQGRSTAALLSELLSHCVVEAHALSSRPAGDVIAEHSKLSDLLDGVKYHDAKAAFVKAYASRAVWKTLRFNTSAGLLRHVLPSEHWLWMPPLEDLALLVENHSPTISRVVLRALHKLLQLMYPEYGREHVRFPLPLCVVPPDTVRQPKVRTRRGANTAGSAT